MVAWALMPLEATPVFQFVPVDQLDVPPVWVGSAICRNWGRLVSQMLESKRGLLASPMLAVPSGRPGRNWLERNLPFDDRSPVINGIMRSVPPGLTLRNLAERIISKPVLAVDGSP